METSRFRNLFTPKLLKQAERLWQDRKATIGLVEAALRKLTRKESPLEPVREDFNALLRLIKASATGQYSKVPWSSILTGLGAVIYFVNPFDIVPDFIIGAGFLDDATVMTMALKTLHKDLNLFRAWETTDESEIE